MTDTPLSRPRTIADQIPITEIMARDPVCTAPDVAVTRLAQIMTEHRIGCVPIVDERRRPIGIVTRFDLVDDMDRSARAHGVHRMGRTGRDVMMPLALTLDERATVAHAASMMTLEDLHHVMIIRGDGVLVGIVSSKDIVRWLVQNDGICCRPT